MATNTVAELPITEKKPFIPQAQGMISSPLPLNSVSPEGKGIPIGMASGPMSKLQTNIRIHKDRPAKTSCSHQSKVEKTITIIPIQDMHPQICLDVTLPILPASRLPIPEYTRNEPITTLAEKTGDRKSVV